MAVLSLPSASRTRGRGTGRTGRATPGGERTQHASTGMHVIARRSSIAAHAESCPSCRRRPISAAISPHRRHTPLASDRIQSCEARHRQRARPILRKAPHAPLANLASGPRAQHGPLTRPLSAPSSGVDSITREDLVARGRTSPHDIASHERMPASGATHHSHDHSESPAKSEEAEAAGVSRRLQPRAPGGELGRGGEWTEHSNGTRRRREGAQGLGSHAPPLGCGLPSPNTQLKCARSSLPPPPLAPNKTGASLAGRRSSARSVVVGEP